MNVLSLFDGISCGQLALQRAGIQVDNYFASEVDENAIKITMKNFPNTIQLGSVVDVKASDLPKIDLLIGGSPCQGFSFAGKQLNFDDPRSKLFFEFTRLLKELNPTYFLLENVKMKKEYEDVITKWMGVEPHRINSKLLSKQNRERLYWTNIPVAPIQDKGLYFNKWLYRLGHGYIKDEVKLFEKYPSLAAQSPGTKYRIIVDPNMDQHTKEQLRRDSSIARVATPEECEEFQTLPKGYTEGIPNTHRYKAIGNGWTVDVVAHIFKGLQLPAS